MNKKQIYYACIPNGSTDCSLMEWVTERDLEYRTVRDVVLTAFGNKEVQVFKKNRYLFIVENEIDDLWGRKRTNRRVYR